MNERIKQLAKQVDSEFNSPYDRHKAIERFAELIIWECGVALNPPVQNRNVISREQAYDLIKKHFGVE